jgi:hypothetical protein
VARAHQTLIWELTRHTLRLRAALQDYFPAALEAYKALTLTGADTLDLLTKAPTPAAAAKLTLTQISAALKKARRRDIPAKATAIQQALRAEQLRPSRGRQHRLCGHRLRDDRAPADPQHRDPNPGRRGRGAFLVTARTLRSTSVNPASA